MASDRLAGVPAKAHDAVWTVVVTDPIAVPIAGALGRLGWVTPNRLTLVATLFAAGAAAAFATEQLILGAILFQMSFAVDCMDGKLAASRGLSSRWGGFVDVAGDMVRIVGCTLALGVAMLDE